ncbi:hypothetical protein ASPVEDRAFT_823105 [Aspergillus versicolor CBS 583.65]|uniref:Uncharacterized protein n=1 Tax=Aspergillus versicolor CBS 583.65 TaxID=1036611 RepID=A0A1L9PU27_ASPVE|nr:uncharacterized protein ASPVEDRAFT_823105 [Aspergillus versicolor CBS 583.65]OJJ04942.1 hypothetical protein ASPVEDRAFT_823105 [Aspergillus versicolor CBS 583.65]
MSVGTPVVGVVGLKAQSTVLGGVSESSRNESVCCVCNGMYVCNAVRRRKPYGGRWTETVNRPLEERMEVSEMNNNTGANKRRGCAVQVQKRGQITVLVRRVMCRASIASWSPEAQRGNRREEKMQREKNGKGLKNGLNPRGRMRLEDGREKNRDSDRGAKRRWRRWVI